jgi:hypothetical protein
MTPEQLCPVCGCTIAEAGHEKEGVTYCCEPCATDSTVCDCGCCHHVEEAEQK